MNFCCENITAYTYGNNKHYDYNDSNNNKKQDSVFSLSLQNIIGSSYIDVKTNLQSEAPNIETGSIFSLKRDQGLQQESVLM